MTTTVGGLDTILSCINSESEKNVSRILLEAKSKAETIIKSAEKTAASMKNEAVNKADVLFSETVEHQKNALKHDENQKILAEKQKILNMSITDGINKIKKFDDKKYFELMKSLIAKYAADTKSDGTLYMNEHDIKRMTADFENMLKNSYPNITIDSDNTIDAGFKIKYGGIEDNCTIDAVVEAELDNIKTNVSKILFV
ncbi:MAG: V-type ATP synthase subunit E [Clostridiales bacterium]|nr:V-type ATP synthase subunit E [Clostridiales bacterium]